MRTMARGRPEKNAPKLGFCHRRRRARVTDDGKGSTEEECPELEFHRRRRRARVANGGEGVAEEEKAPRSQTSAMTRWPELGFHHRRRGARIVDGGKGAVAGSRVPPSEKKGPRHGRAARARPKKRRPRGHGAGDVQERYTSWAGARG
jgi:hypothetical protein